MRRMFRLVVSRDVRCRTDDYGKCVHSEVYRHEKVTVSLRMSNSKSVRCSRCVYVSHT